MNDRKQSCALEIIDVQTGERQVLARFDQVVEAPNWTRDGKTLIYNSNGRIFRFDLATRTSFEIDTSFADLCNNDHVLSPDGQYLAISHFTADDIKSRIYIVPITGGTPRCVTEKGPSYLHGWSPDGESLAYCAERDGAYNIHTISVKGGAEQRLTASSGLNDGPEYAPDGETIWFNSTRSGLMQVWRMGIDGSHPERMTSLEINCWFPHLSPDGQQVAYIAYHTCDLQPEEHLPDLPIQIRMMDRTGQNDHVIAEFMGGQGTMNVNSWSPDGQSLAFVSY
jgi:TolB protein